MKYRPRINCIIPNATDSTALYRSSGVLSKLKYDIDCQFSFDTSISWASLSWFDILFLQRPWGNSLYKACIIAKNNNTPIWIDYDDYLIDVPVYNPANKFFSGKQDQEDMIEMIKLATVVTVTTEKLREKFLPFNKNVFIVPNAFNDYMFKWEYNFSKNKSINWRGSSSHRNDLHSLLEALIEIQRNPISNNFRWNFIGTDSELLKGFIKFKSHPVLDPVEYFYFIKELNPLIQLSPLVINDFNQCKSNIAWIEATYSGAITIAPKQLIEFNRPGLLLYDTIEDFKKILLSCMEINSEQLKKFYDASFDFISSNLLLSKVNNLRKQIVIQLMDDRSK